MIHSIAPILAWLLIAPSLSQKILSSTSFLYTILVFRFDVSSKVITMIYLNVCVFVFLCCVHT